MAFVFLLSCGMATQPVAETYKYKDIDGQWVFSDKKPSANVPATKIKHAVHKIALPNPELSVKNEEGEFQLSISNPYYAPIEILVTFSDQYTTHISRVIEAKSTVILLDQKDKISNYKLQWVLGRPWAEPRKYLYQVPIGSPLPHKITQGFNGRFSHYTPGGQYALDIGADMGTEVVASRGGTVIAVKDDYHMSGTQVYFLDKANFVSVLHDDGTYATYAHTLLGSAVVQPGDKVDAGDKLAKTGSSGFSTGPHLHFVIQKNDGFKTVAVPFQIADREGKPVTPALGMLLYGSQQIAPRNSENRAVDFRLQQVELLEFADGIEEDEQSVEELMEQTLLDKECERARLRLVVLGQEHLPIFKDEEDNLYAEWHYDVFVGKRRYLSKTEQLQEKNSLEKIVNQTCREPNDQEIMQYYERIWVQKEECAWLQAEADEARDPKYKNDKATIAKRQYEADEMCGY